MVAYGAELFEKRLNHARIRRRFDSLRGFVARTITGPLANILPIVLLVVERIYTEKDLM